MADPSAPPADDPADAPADVPADLPADLPAPYNLQHFNRAPIPLSRLSSHLWVRIFKQHPASTQIKLLEVSCQTSSLVETIMEETPCVKEAAEVVSDMIKPDGPCPVMRMLYPHIYPINERIMLRAWAVEVIHAYDFDTIYRFSREKQKLKRKLCRLKRKYSKSQKIPLEGIWEREQVYGPGKIQLDRLSLNMLMKVVIKSSTSAVARLACTSTFGRGAAVTCFENSWVLETMEVEGRMLTKCSPNCKITYYSETLWAQPFEHFYCLWELDHLIRRFAINNKNAYFDEKRRKQEEEQEYLAPLGYSLSKYLEYSNYSLAILGND